ncbi:MAG: lactate utilization protein [Bacteroidetes bacterium]|nr:lactate utilization protein [Bacteroidota bacterium]MBS1649414.1 lactate utilization protein [Bacteroidota bacterium]
MNVSASKENILKKIRQALSHPTNLPFPASEGVDSVFKSSQQELEFEFAEKFTKLQGRFSFCENQQQLTEQLNTLITARNWQKIFCKEDILKQNLTNNGFTNFHTTDIHSCDAAITSCEQLIARTGSIVMSAAQQSGRTVSVYAPVHICIAYTNQLVYDIKDAITNVKEKYFEALPSLITLATGPSRTADIEKTLVVGVHGPKEVFCFLVEE